MYHTWNMSVYMPPFSAAMSPLLSRPIPSSTQMLPPLPSPSSRLHLDTANGSIAQRDSSNPSHTTMYKTGEDIQGVPPGVSHPLQIHTKWP